MYRGKPDRQNNNRSTRYNEAHRRGQGHCVPCQLPTIIKEDSPSKSGWVVHPTDTTWHFILGSYHVVARPIYGTTFKLVLWPESNKEVEIDITWQELVAMAQDRVAAMWEAANPDERY